MALPLSSQVFAITARLIEEHTGLHFEPSHGDLLAEKLSDRAGELGLESLLDYYYFLRYDPGGAVELATLAERLVIHETYFFREVAPLRALVESIVPELLQSRSRVRVWSAACATGEEPYTLALMLADAALLDRVDIVASDLSERALAKARDGRYAGRSLRAWPASRCSNQLVAVVPEGLHVSDALRGRIAWRPVNLMDREAVVALGLFDVVLCRNVLIYFTDDTVVRVIKNLGDVLSPDGVLLVGASESLLRFGTLFTCVERGGSFFYRRAAA